MPSYVTRVERISHLYTTQRAVVPLLNIDPVIDLDENNCISKIPMVDSHISSDSEYDISPGDVIRIDFEKDTLPKITVIERNTANTNDLRYEVCPYCGQPLIKIGDHSYCFNLDCHAQRVQSIILFASSLGLSFTGSNLRVLESLLSRSLVNNVTDLFNLSVESIITSEISVFEAQVFQQYVHSVRGRVTAEQILRGLHIPIINEDDIRMLTFILSNENLTVGDMDRLFDSDIQQKYADYDWSRWNLFTSVHENAELISILAKLLYF